MSVPVSVGEGVMVGSVEGVSVGVSEGGIAVSMGVGVSVTASVEDGVGVGDSPSGVHVTVSGEEPVVSAAVGLGSWSGIGREVMSTGIKNPAARKPAAGRARRGTWVISIPLRPYRCPYYQGKRGSSQQRIGDRGRRFPRSPARVTREGLAGSRRAARRRWRRGTRESPTISEVRAGRPAPRGRLK